MSIGRLVVDLVANTGSFETDIGRASKAASKRAQEIDRAFNRIGTVIAAAGAAAAVGLSALIKSSIDGADNLNDLSKASGVSVESLSALGYAAKLSGTDMDSLAIGMKKLSNAAYDAAKGNKAAADTFKTLGVNVKNADGSLRSTEEILFDVADVFSKYEDGAAKAALAQDLFGKSGTELIPFLNQGRDGIKELTDEAARFGIVISQETASAADEFNDNLERLRSATSGLGAQLSAKLLPSLVKVTDQFVDFAKNGDAVSGVADRIDAAFKLVADIGSRVAETFVDVGSALGAIAAAAVQAATGNFREAYDIIKQANEDGKKRDQEYTDFRKKLWEDSGKAVVASAEKTAEGIKKAQFVVSDNSAAEAAKKLADEQKRAQQSIESLITSLRTQIDTYGQGETAVIRYRIAHGDLADEFAKVGEGGLKLADELASLTNQLEVMRDAAEAAGESISDIADANLEGLEETLGRIYEPLERELVKVAKNGEFNEQFKDGIYDSLKTGIKDGFKDGADEGLKGFRDSFFDTMGSIASDIIAKQLAEALFSSIGNMGNGSTGGGGSWLDTAFNFIGSYFGGARATGGPVSAGMMYQVNEREPEFFRPNVSGKVIPLSKMVGGGGGITQNISVQGRPEQRTARQLALETARMQRVANARLG